MSEQQTTDAAPWVAPWMDGYAARHDGLPRLPGACADWRAGWDAAHLDMEVARYGY